VHVPRSSLADLKQQPRHVTADERLGVFVARGWTVRAGTRHGSIVEKAGHTHLDHARTASTSSRYTCNERSG